MSKITNTIKEINNMIKNTIKSPFNSNNNTPNRSRANSIDLDSSYDMLSNGDRERILRQLLSEAGFLNDESIETKKTNKITNIHPI